MSKMRDIGQHPRRRGPHAALAFPALLLAMLCAAVPGAAESPDRSYWDYDLGALAAPAPRGLDCPAFFDSDPATGAQPPPPPLEALDRAVLRACGPLGGRVSEAEFEALIAEHFERLAAELPPDWRGVGRAALLARLKRIWLTHRGFDHVFCGEWRRGSIGGLHYRGRFLQLQAEGAACYWPSEREEIREGRIYSLGVVSADGRFRHPIKGYALAQDAAALFGLASRAASACCRPGDRGWRPYRAWHSRAFYTAAGEAGGAILNRVVCRADEPGEAASIGLVTIYADATPDPPVEICPSAEE